MKCEACADPRPDCMGMLVEGIGNRCAALSEGTASAQRINRVAAVPRCDHFPACTYPEGQCAELCLPGGLKP